MQQKKKFSAIPYKEFRRRMIALGFKIVVSKDGQEHFQGIRLKNKKPS